MRGQKKADEQKESGGRVTAGPAWYPTAGPVHPPRHMTRVPGRSASGASAQAGSSRRSKSCSCASHLYAYGTWPRPARGAGFRHVPAASDTSPRLALCMVCVVLSACPHKRVARIVRVAPQRPAAPCPACAGEPHSCGPCGSSCPSHYSAVPRCRAPLTQGAIVPRVHAALSYSAHTGSYRAPRTRGAIFDLSRMRLGRRRAAAAAAAAGLQGPTAACGAPPPARAP